MERNFETADLYLSSFIKTILPDIPLTFEVKNGRTFFLFPASDDLYKATAAFNNGLPINAFEYSQMIKRLRAEMIMRRGQK